MQNRMPYNDIRVFVIKYHIAISGVVDHHALVGPVAEGLLN